MPSATLPSRPRRRRRAARGGAGAAGAAAAAAAAGVCLLLMLCLHAGVEALLVRPGRLASQRQSSFGGRVALARQRGLASPLTMAAAAADGGGGMEAEGGGGGSSSKSAKASSGRGFGDAVRRGSGNGATSSDDAAAAGAGGGGVGKAGRPRRGRPNSFSSLGQAVRHRGKFGHGAPFELGLLDMSSKLMERHEAVKERYAGARPVQQGGGRQRGAKKAAAFTALSSYSLHFLKLLEEELLYEEAEVMQRLRHWTRGRLQEEGLAVFGVVARPRGRLFKEHILRFTLPARKGGGGGGGGKGGEGGGKGKYSGAKGKYGAGAGGGPPGRAPPLHFHRLGPGDIISITPDRQNPLGSSEVIEGLVLERGPFFIDVVVKEIPPGVVYKRGDPTGGERFRLDLYLNRISFQRMVAAVHQVTGFETGFTVSTELRDILVKSFAERFDVLFPSAPQHQHASHHPSSLVAMSPYTGAKRGGDPRRVTASRERERGRLHEEEAEQARRTRAKAQRKAAGAGGGANGGAGPSSSWEAMASGVPKTFYGRKEADKAVSEEVERFGLNESQEAALRMALARKLSLIQGPPGTGKTRTACHLINIAVRLQRRRGDGKVLAVAFSNVAADNLLEGCLRLGLNAVRVGRAATVRPELRNHTLDALLANHESVATFKKKLEGARQAGSTSTEIQAAKRDLEDAELLAAVSILGNADVVVSTCVGAANEAIVNAAAVTVSAGPGKGSSPLRAIKFPTVIVDEASQATEPATLVPLTQGCEQLVLVGDHYQLPPTIKSFRAQQQGLGVSMFTRLALAGIRPSMLTVQYRMHPLIAQFPSRRFYGGLLQTHPANKHRPRPEGFPWPNPQLPVAFVAVGGDEDASSMGPFFEQRTSGNQTSYLNRKEGEVLVDVLNGVLRRGHVQCKDVGIVTPYSAQVKHVTELAQTRLRPFNAADLEIQSVDAYQGREKELILISAVRSNRHGKVGFLGDWRRLNVAITRAKRGIVVVGDPRTLRHDPHWGAYLRWCLKRECVMSLTELRRLLQHQVAAAKSSDPASSSSSATAGADAEGEAHAVECEVVV